MGVSRVAFAYRRQNSPSLPTISHFPWEKRGGGEGGKAIANKILGRAHSSLLLSNAKYREEKPFAVCSPDWKLFRGLDGDLIILVGRG